MSLDSWIGVLRFGGYGSSATAQRHLVKVEGRKTSAEHIAHIYREYPLHPREICLAVCSPQPSTLAWKGCMIGWFLQLQPQVAHSLPLRQRESHTALVRYLQYTNYSAISSILQRGILKDRGSLYACFCHFSLRFDHVRLNLESEFTFSPVSSSLLSPLFPLPIYKFILLNSLLLYLRIGKNPPLPTRYSSL